MNFFFFLCLDFYHFLQSYVDDCVLANTSISFSYYDLEQKLKSSNPNLVIRDLEIYFNKEASMQIVSNAGLAIEKETKLDEINGIKRKRRHFKLVIVDENKAKMHLNSINKDNKGNKRNQHKQ